MQPYLTQWHGNERMDVLLALRAAAVCAPGSVVLPLNEKGKRSFKLEHVAPANGFAGHDAHDALGDVSATMHLAKMVRDRCPALWQACASIRAKDGASAILSAGCPLVQVDWNHAGDRPQTRVLLPVTTDRQNANEWLCVNLSATVAELVQKDASSLQRCFRSIGGLKPIVPVKANSMPLIFRMDDPTVAALELTFDPVDLQILEQADGFAERLRDASQLCKDAYPEQTHFRKMLYSGGFFPMRGDRALFDEFHQAPPNEKYEIVTQFDDSRAVEIGRWLIGSEWPDVMPAGERTWFHDAQWQHLTADDEEWTTVPSALREISKLKQDADPEGTMILEEYEHHLTGLLQSGIT